ncbi:hypothetical protein, partial [Candidatus Darwinibacter acetoxidans]
IDLQNKVRLEGDAALSDIQNAYAMKELDLLQDYANRQAQYEQMVYQAQLAQQQWEQEQAANWEKYERERQDYLSDVMSEREWKEAQTQAEREYQMMLQRMKGSGSSGATKPSATWYRDDADFQGYIAELDSGQATVEDVTRAAQQLIAMYGMAGYDELLKRALAAEAYAPFAEAGGTQRQIVPHTTPIPGR